MKRRPSTNPPNPTNPEYDNFTRLLRRIVTVPKSEIQKRMEDDKATKDWTAANHQPKHRNRPIVSPSSVSSSKTP